VCDDVIQVRYDFGLRGIIHLLRVLGSIKRCSLPDDSEEQVLVVQAVLDFNLAQVLSSTKRSSSPVDSEEQEIIAQASSCMKSS